MICNELRAVQRCLDKARWCDAETRYIQRIPLCDMDDHQGWQHDDEFWQRWHKRWLCLAYKLMEAINVIKKD